LENLVLKMRNITEKMFLGGWWIDCFATT
jgi:hypothetical protein